MTDATTAFFQALETRGHAPRLEKVTGTFRFDITNGKRRERWLVTVDKGDLEVSHRNARPTVSCAQTRRFSKALWPARSTPSPPSFAGRCRSKGMPS